MIQLKKSMDKVASEKLDKVIDIKIVSVFQRGTSSQLAADLVSSVGNHDLDSHLKENRAIRFFLSKIIAEVFSEQDAYRGIRLLEDRAMDLQLLENEIRGG